jgi:hypothetical protein
VRAVRTAWGAMLRGLASVRRRDRAMHRREVPMSARLAVVTVAFSVAANACGTIVSPDVAPVDAALSDVARADAPAPLPDVPRSIRTALRPDSEVYLYRARTRSEEDRTTVYLSVARRDDVVGPVWEEITEGHCTISTHGYPYASGSDVEQIDPFLVELRWNDELLSSCRGADCRAREFATPARLDIPITMDVRVLDVLMDQTQCVQPAIGVEVLTRDADRSLTWHPSQPLQFRWTPDARVQTVAVWIEDNVFADGRLNTRRELRCVAPGSAGEITVPASMMREIPPNQPLLAIVGARNECVVSGGGWTVRGQLWTEARGLAVHPRP